jgi:hypothetical protein
MEFYPLRVFVRLAQPERKTGSANYYAGVPIVKVYGETNEVKASCISGRARDNRCRKTELASEGTHLLS